MATNKDYIWNFLMLKLNNEYGVAALMGNIQAESAFIPANVQNGFGWEDGDYTSQVNSGSYSENAFVNDEIGYGLCQWTYFSRKQNLYNLFKSGGYASIGSLKLQCEFIWWELNNGYSGTLDAIKNASSIREASDYILHNYEQPYDQSESAEITRAGYASSIYAEYTGTVPSEPEDPDEPGEPPKYITWGKNRGYNFLLMNRRRRFRQYDKRRI